MQGNVLRRGLVLCFCLGLGLVAGQGKADEKKADQCSKKVLDWLDSNLDASDKV